ncbi:MAG: helix-turn-helix domain-containing protein [Croceivirga sp.]
MIVERLKTIISYYQLTPSSFADAIRVPRSSISHLLSGRNKPSLEFVLKLIKTYPQVNLYWLLNGKGVFPSPHETEASVPNGLKKMPSPNKGANLNSATAGKPIQKIVVLYEDGTFDAYHPNE